MTLLSAMPSDCSSTRCCKKKKKKIEKKVRILHQSVKLISHRLDVLRGLVEPNLSVRPNPNQNFCLSHRKRNTISAFVKHSK